MSRSGVLAALIITASVLVSAARAEDAARPPTGGVTSPTGAVIFYLAHGRDGSCGPNCSEWIAAEGVVEWDTFKRLFAFCSTSAIARPQSFSTSGAREISTWQ